MRRLLLIMLLIWTGTARASGFWDGLWQTPDQEGEQLLQQGHPADAARTYRDPRRKAYAELQAGNFPQAAQDFARFDDSDDHYNRGNALARAGQLQDAIKAYDAALTRNPNNRDARHNRDLVARALQQQQQQQQSNSGSGKEDKKGIQDKQANSGKSDKNQKGQTGDQQGKPGQDKSGQPNGQGQQDAKANKPDRQGQPNGEGQSQQDRQAQARSGQQSSSQTSSQTGNAAPAGEQKPDSASEVREDAAASLGKQTSGQPVAATDQPMTEQQLAQEQWLRQIPDDPGGLLKRKFMIEHMIRQQGGTQ